MEKIIKKSLLSLGLILLYLFFTSIPLVILYFLGINYTTWAKSTLIIYEFGCNIILLLFMCFIYRKILIKDFKNYFNKNIFNNIETSVKYWAAGLSITIVSNLILFFITKGDTANNQETVEQLIKLAPIYMAFNVCIYAPLLEELIFRKSIRNITDNKWGYILLSGIVFGSLHVITSMESIIDLLYIIPYSSLGIAFAACYYKTDNIFSTITIHAIHNTLSFILLIATGIV